MNFVKGPLKFKGGVTSKQVIEKSTNKLLEKRKRPSSPENDQISSSAGNNASEFLSENRSTKKEVKRTDYEKKVQIHREKRVLERVDKKLKTTHRYFFLY